MHWRDAGAEELVGHGARTGSFEHACHELATGVPAAVSEFGHLLLGLADAHRFGEGGSSGGRERPGVLHEAAPGHFLLGSTQKGRHVLLYHRFYEPRRHLEHLVDAGAAAVAAAVALP